MKHWFSDVSAFRRDPLGFLLGRGSAPASEPLEKLFLGPKPVYLVTDANLVKPLLRLEGTAVDKGRLIRKLKPIVGESTLVLNGEENARRRGALHKHLARGAAEKFAPQMSAEIRAMAARLAATETFCPHRVTAPLAIRMMCIAVFGKQVLSAADEATLIEAVNSVEDDIAEEMFRALPQAPWSRWSSRKRRQAAKAQMSFVVERVRERASSTSALRSLEDLSLSPDDLRDELLTLLLAGHHTTGSTAAWLLYHLAVEPGLLRQIAEEADLAMDANGEIQASRLKDLDVSQALVREVLRLYPAGWWFAREVTEPVTFGGRQLERGTSLIVCPWHLHHDPSYWKEPDAFRLDRNFGGPAYIPFGAGARACIGMGVAMLELQLLALEMAGAYELTSRAPLPHRWPTALVTLIPPPMSMSVYPRGSRGVSTLMAAE